MRTGTAVPETTVYVSGLSVRYVRLWLPGDIVQEDGWVEKPAISFKGDMQMRTGRSACRADVCDNLAGNDTASDPYVRFPDKMTITDSETPVPQFYIISWTLVISYMGNFPGSIAYTGVPDFADMSSPEWFSDVLLPNGLRRFPKPDETRRFPLSGGWHHSNGARLPAITLTALLLTVSFFSPASVSVWPFRTRQIDGGPIVLNCADTISPEAMNDKTSNNLI